MTEPTETPLEQIDQAAQDPAPNTGSPAPIAKVVLISVPGGVPNLDAPLEVIMSQSPDMATRVRLPLSLYDPQDQAYDPWLKVAWVLECRVPRLAVTFREELDQFVRGFVERHQ